MNGVNALGLSLSRDLPASHRSRDRNDVREHATATARAAQCASCVPWAMAVGIPPEGVRFSKAGRPPSDRCLKRRRRRAIAGTVRAGCARVIRRCSVPGATLAALPTSRRDPPHAAAIAATASNVATPPVYLAVFFVLFCLVPNINVSHVSERRLIISGARCDAVHIASF